MATRQVTGTLVAPDGSALAGAEMLFGLADDTYQTSPAQTLPQISIPVITDSAGAFTVTLVSGLSVRYRVTLPDPVRNTFEVAVPDGASTTLEALRAADTGEPVAVETIEAAIQAFAGATYVNVSGDTMTGALSVDHALTVNDSGADRDTRVEGDTDANLLFIDASTDRVGIGTVTPTAKLDVNGSLRNTGDVGLYGVTPVARAASPGTISAAAINTTYDINERDVLSDVRTVLNNVVTALRNVGIVQ